MNLTQFVPLILIAVIAIVSFIGWRNTFVFQRYQFQIAAIRYNKQYQRLITSAFLHADGWHLFFNLFTLYFFSRVIAYIYGWLGFLLLFFGAVLAGNLFSLWLYKNRPSYAAIGASGGVSGILFASITINPMSEIMIFPIPIHFISCLLGCHDVKPTPMGQHGTRGAFGRSSLRNAVCFCDYACFCDAKRAVFGHYVAALAVFGIRSID